ncbi:hypothetical protein HMPREF9148_02108 [Prevotella sp. F0091]|nr:hypothetical protein HMPREF9148_02108 [Prevotella sp. F0091]
MHREKGAKRMSRLSEKSVRFNSKRKHLSGFRTNKVYLFVVIRYYTCLHILLS